MKTLSGSVTESATTEIIYVFQERKIDPQYINLNYRPHGLFLVVLAPEHDSSVAAQVGPVGHHPILGKVPSCSVCSSVDLSMIATTCP